MVRTALTIAFLWATQVLLIVDSDRAEADSPDPRDVAEWQCTQCTSKIQAASRACASRARKDGKFGDVIVKLASTKPLTGDYTKSIPVTTTAEATGGLEKKDARCVKDKVDALACAGNCYLVDESVLDIPVGEPRPLLPPAGELVPVWRKYLDSGSLTGWWRRRSLSGMLTDDFRITPEGCLWIPWTDNVRVGLMLWLAQTGNEIPFSAVMQLKQASNDPHWPMRWDSGRVLADGHSVLVDDGPLLNASRNWREYDGTSGTRICLVANR